MQDDISYEITEYTVRSGDSLWSIAQKFNLNPETILWGNDVKDGDTLETLQRLHGTPTQEIFEYFGNEFDITQTPQ
ncbi:MAG TPA: LysM domain-containing protein [Anaerolineales bacterium]